MQLTFERGKTMYLTLNVIKSGKVYHTVLGTLTSILKLL